MTKKINESIKFLFNEVKRLNLKEKSKKISKEEKQTLKKLLSFMGKND
jgi:hypothetical protein|tara:strand:+ start:1140 stop:1283 length:144 start_codon:yes stop_codon:yes gene_type:complete